MAKRKSKSGFLGLSNATLLLIGGGVVLYYLTRPKTENSSIGSLNNRQLKLQDELFQKYKKSNVYYFITFLDYLEDVLSSEKVYNNKKLYNDVYEIYNSFEDYLRWEEAKNKEYR